MTDCVISLGFTEGCSSCWVDMAQCAKSKCTWNCGLDMSGSKCKKCTETYC